jgi:hypothetical protein
MCAHRWINLKFQLRFRAGEDGEEALELNQQLIENRADCYLGERHYMYMYVPFTVTLSNANCFPAWLPPHAPVSESDAVIYCLFVKNDFLIYIS